ncbi:MAG: type VI secretion system Vgr family protein [Planctomycetota bacterium]|jgi:type VI secretion system secreted protein VgrG
MPIVETHIEVGLILLKIGEFEEQKFSVIRYRGTESLNQLYRFELQLASEDQIDNFDDIVGQPCVMTVGYEMRQNESVPRSFHGIVSFFEMVGETKQQTYYRAEFVPSLWLLTHRYNSRIFQKKSVKEIIEAVLQQAGMASDRMDLSRITESTRVREYCVQYRETDYNFICRLMEEEGIWWYFTQSDTGDVFVAADSQEDFQTIEGQDQFAYVPPGGVKPMGSSEDEQHVYRFRVFQSLRPGSVVLNDFNFENPKLSLQTSSDAGRDTSLEFFECPGEYNTQQDGNELAVKRVEEFEGSRIRARGQSNAVTMALGRKFELMEHPIEAMNRYYSFVSVTHEGRQSIEFTTQGIDIQQWSHDHTNHRARTEWLFHGGQVSRDSAQTAMALGRDPFDSLTVPNAIDDPVADDVDDAKMPTYQCRFEAIPSDQKYRPPRITPWPVMRGIQTARVVGPEGEEIYTDKYGRVKVQFNWDREGGFSEDASCWIRVAQGMAGGNYGTLFIPRIGQEVVVEFVEGNPDNPLITGSVYNNDHMPPYQLPDNKTRSVIKTNSSKDGSGNNEIRFEDLTDNEQLFIQAQRQMDTRVKASHFHTVGGNYHLHVGGDDKGESRELVHKDKHVHVQQHLNTWVEGNEGHDISSDRWVSVNGVEEHAVAGNCLHRFLSNHMLDVGQTFHAKGTSIKLDATAGIEFVCGGSSICLTPGAIFIQGPIVNINSGAGPPVTPVQIPQLRPETCLDAAVADSSDPGHDTRYDGGEEPSEGAMPPGLEPPEIELQEREEPKVTYEFEVLDADGDPLPGESYEVYGPDGELFQSGKTSDPEAVVELLDVPPGEYKLDLPERDDFEWKKLDVEPLGGAADLEDTQTQSSPTGSPTTSSGTASSTQTGIPGAGGTQTGGPGSGLPGSGGVDTGGGTGSGTGGETGSDTQGDQPG